MDTRSNPSLAGSTPAGTGGDIVKEVGVILTLAALLVIGL